VAYRYQQFFRLAALPATMSASVPWQGSPVPPGRGGPRPFVGVPQCILY